MTDAHAMLGSQVIITAGWVCLDNDILDISALLTQHNPSVMGNDIYYTEHRQSDHAVINAQQTQC